MNTPTQTLSPTIFGKAMSRAKETLHRMKNHAPDIASQSIAKVCKGVKKSIMTALAGVSLFTACDVPNAAVVPRALDSEAQVAQRVVTAEEFLEPIADIQPLEEVTIPGPVVNPYRVADDFSFNSSYLLESISSDGVVRPFSSLEGLSEHQLRKTPLGDFIWQRANSLGDTEKKAVLNELPTIVSSTIDQVPVFTINKRLYQDGVTLYPKFLSLLPHYERGALLAEFQKAVEIFQQVTTLPTKIVEKEADANVTVGIRGVEQPIRFGDALGTAFTYATADPSKTFMYNNAHGFNQVTINMYHDVDPFVSEVMPLGWNMNDGSTSPELQAIQQILVRQRVANALRKDTLLKVYGPVLVHELGHILGAEHSRQRESLMWSSMDISRFPTLHNNGRVDYYYGPSTYRHTGEWYQDPFLKLVRWTREFVVQEAAALEKGSL